MKRVIIFASGSGSNAEKIVEYFKGHEEISVVKIMSNKAEAGVLARATRLGVPSEVFSKKQMQEPGFVESLKAEADFIVLAGFLLKIPEALIEAYPDKIINIHPALLPKYGGKGMYGMNVHRAVVDNKETESGISIHFVNANYDEGAIIFQARTAVDPSDGPEEVAQKIHALEYQYFPKVIEETIMNADAG